MKILKPFYYDDFNCIANKCIDSCCIGWKISIDENTYKNAMDLNAVKEDIKYQLEDSDAKLNRIFSDEKFAYWKQFLSKKVIKQYEK